jgi:hypothetical protein
MYKPLRGHNGQLYYVFDEDAAEEFLDSGTLSPNAWIP